MIRAVLGLLGLAIAAFGSYRSGFHDGVQVEKARLECPISTAHAITVGGRVTEIVIGPITQKSD